MTAVCVMVREAPKTHKMIPMKQYFTGIECEQPSRMLRLFVNEMG